MCLFIKSYLTVSSQLQFVLLSVSKTNVVLNSSSTVFEPDGDSSHGDQVDVVQGRSTLLKLKDKVSVTLRPGLPTFLFN